MNDEVHVSENTGGGGADYELPPIGPQPALPVHLYPLGWQPGLKGKTVQKVVILFELAAKMTKGDFAGKRFRISQQYTQGFGTSEKPTNLRRDLVSWRGGKAFSEQELKDFLLNKILLKPCVLNLQQIVKKNGDPFIVVGTILPPPRVNCPTCNGVAGKKDCPKCKGVGAVLGMALWTPDTPADYVPKWIQDAIAKQLPAPEKKADPHAGEGAGVDDLNIPF